MPIHARQHNTVGGYPNANVCEKGVLFAALRTGLDVVGSSCQLTAIGTPSRAQGTAPVGPHSMRSGLSTPVALCQGLPKPPQSSLKAILGRQPIGTPRLLQGHTKATPRREPGGQFTPSVGRVCSANPRLPASRPASWNCNYGTATRRELRRARVRRSRAALGLRAAAVRSLASRKGTACTGMGASSSERSRGFERAAKSSFWQPMSTTLSLLTPTACRAAWWSGWYG